MKVFLIEDDILWRTKLEMMVEEIGLAIMGTSDNLRNSRAFLSAHVPDLIMADIMLGDELIFDLFADGRFSNIPVLFLTQSMNPENYSQAKHLQHSHFLVKPFPALSLQAAVDILMKPLLDKDVEPAKGIDVRGRHNEKIRLPASEIVHVQQDRNYCIIRTANQKFALKTSLSRLLEQVGDEFLQVNRACIVNKYFITRITMDNSQVKVASELITIGRTFKADVLKYMSEQTWL